jgi:putative flippase GtrA
VSLARLTINVGVTVAGAWVMDLRLVAVNVAGIGSAFLISFWLNSVTVFREAHARATLTPSPMAATSRN